MNSKVLEILNEKLHQEFDDNQTSMADTVGVKQGTFSKILSGKVTTPYRHNAQAIADYLHINIEEVYGDTKYVIISDSSLLPDESDLLRMHRAVKELDADAATDAFDLLKHCYDKALARFGKKKGNH